MTDNRTSVQKNLCEEDKDDKKEIGIAKRKKYRNKQY
jgi:hypothetical protein